VAKSVPTRNGGRIEGKIMWKQGLILVTLLAACDSTSGGGGSGGSGSDYKKVSIASSVGKTYVTEGPVMAMLNGFDEPLNTNATIQFVSSKQIVMNGITLNKDSDSNTFRSADGKTTLQVNNSIDGVSTDQILYYLSTQDSGSTTMLGAMVSGNTTASADIPHTGTAIYSGKMTVYGDLGLPSTTDGPVLIVQLATADLSGSVSFANRSVALDPTKMVNGTFYTTMQSAEPTPVVAGTIDGSFFGAGASEMGGTLTFDYAPTGTPTEAYVGYYGATRQ
jgi:hypothetical protein